VARGYPLVGVLPRIVKNPPAGLAEIAHAHPGQVLVVPVGPMRLYLVTHPPHVEHVLHTHWRNYSKDTPIYRSTLPLLGKSLVTKDGAAWIAARRTVQPMFNHKHLVSLAAQMGSTISRVLGALAERTRNGEPVELYQEMNILTQMVLLECLFDVETDRAEAEHLGNLLNDALRGISKRMLFSFLPSGFPLPGTQGMVRAIAGIEEGLKRLTQRWEQRERKERISMLALLREATDPETGEKMSTQQLRDELMTLWVGGNESTAATMAWLWYLMSHHPEVEARMRIEVSTVLGDREPVVTDLERLPYCKRVLLETMRLYPASWQLPRQCMEDDVVDGFRIPKGASVLVSQYITQRDPSVWENPEVFDPDRFLPERVKGRHPYAFLPFGGGPRRCVGEHFAMMEAQLILAMMVQRFRPQMPEKRTIEVTSMGSLRPKGPVMMRMNPL
jgi:cytochrome P450